MREWINLITEAHGFRIVVPESQQMRYLRGGCYAFAMVLRRHLRARGFPAKLYGLFDGEDCHHAFVVVNDKAYDCRGEMPLDPDVIGKGSAIEGHGEIKPITVKYLNDHHNVAGSSYLYNISKEMQLYLRFD